MLLMGAVLLLRAPDLLEKRLNGKETEKTQQAVLALSFDPANLVKEGDNYEEIYRITAVHRGGGFIHLLRYARFQ